MKNHKYTKYTLPGVSIALAYWFVDSFIDYYVFDAPFEYFPSNPIEAWMRVFIVFLILAFSVYVTVTISRIKKMYEERQQLQLKLEQALSNLLSGFLPICSVCKKVNANPGSKEGTAAWEDIDSYIAHHTEIQFSHGYCPECAAKAKKEIRNMRL